MAASDKESKRNRSRTRSPSRRQTRRDDRSLRNSSRTPREFWLRGACKFGASCRNLHGEDVHQQDRQQETPRCSYYRIELRDLPRDMSWSELKDISRTFGPTVCYTDIYED